MNTQIASSMSTVRDAWSEEERRKRRELAGEMQLQLRALVVLAELSNPREDRDRRATSVASAC